MFTVVTLQALYPIYRAGSTWLLQWVGRVLLRWVLILHVGFPWWLSVKNLPANAGDLGSIPGLGRSLGEGHDKPLQYCLENSMDRAA